MKYKADGVPLVVFAGKEYGTGSSRDWAAKGTNLLGVKAVIAESFERIHRSNLVGMGVLPLQFMDGENAQTLGLDGVGDLRHHRPATTAPRKTADGHRARAPDGSEMRVRGAGAAADAEGSRVLPPRRHPALRAAPAGGEESGVIRLASRAHEKGGASGRLVRRVHSFGSHSALTSSPVVAVLAASRVVDVVRPAPAVGKQRRSPPVSAAVQRTVARSRLQLDVERPERDADLPVAQEHHRGQCAAQPCGPCPPGR